MNQNKGEILGKALKIQKGIEEEKGRRMKIKLER